ncbi:MAG TPA: ATP-binding protein [Anaerolineae bacterium]|nr:ATP-binding protein [Anaerolineae bacterium]HQK12875.1 ATP-binding protein [Anaerolineae bacterium]
MKKIQQLLEKVSLEAEEKRRRKLLNILLTLLGLADGMALLFVGYAGLVDLDTDFMIRSLYRINIILGIGLASLFFINRYWASRLASALFALFLFVAIAWHVGFNAVLLRSTFLAFTIPILIVSFLVYPWAGFVMAALVSGWVVLVAIKLPEIVDLPAILIYFGVAAMAWLFAQSLEQTLNDLRAANRELDARVAARTAELTTANRQLQQEITERERMAKALRESEMRYRTLFDNAPVGIGLTDHDGYLLTLNSTLAQMLGYTVAELQNSNVRTLYVNPEERDVLLRTLQKDGYARNYETMLKRRDGGAFNAILTVTAYPGDNGSIWQAVILDVTSQKQMEAALQRARDEEIAALRELDRLRSELIANFSHDLRTPLGLIKMSCTTLLREDVHFDPQTQREFLEDIETQTDVLTEIVGNILDLARLESGQLHLNKRPTDLEQLTHAILSAILSAMKGRLVRHTVKCLFPETPLVADVDPKYMTELLRNLLDNAIKYSPNGGEITVTGALRDGHIVVQVRDEGVGIPPEALDKVFERFYRVDDDAIRHIGGVGLGLSVCQGIARAHGGHIEVTSTPGQGSTFSVVLFCKEST